MARPRAAVSPSSATVSLLGVKIGRDVAVWCAVGLGVGIVATTFAYVSWMVSGGPTAFGVAVIPLSLVLVAFARVQLARRRRARASDWVALGYTAAIVVSVALLAIEEMLRGIYQELNATVW